MKLYPKSWWVLLAAILSVTGCGGGGGSSTDSGTETTSGVPTNETPPTSAPDNVPSAPDPSSDPAPDSSPGPTSSQPIDSNPSTPQTPETPQPPAPSPNPPTSDDDGPLTLSLSTNKIEFIANNPFQSVPFQFVTGTVTGSSSAGGTLNVVITSSDPSVATVPNVFIGEDSAEAIIEAASPRVLGAGRFTAQIVVKACLNDATCATNQLRGSPQIIDVVYGVAGVTSSVTDLSYEFGNSRTTADLTRKFSISGFPDQNWTATSDVPWLKLAPTTGIASVTTSVSASLDEKLVDALPGGVHTATVTVKPSVGLQVTLPVTLNVTRTCVNYVAPYVVSTSSSSEVIIRGENLSRITVTGVRFGSTDSTSFNVVSDTELRATYPSLSAGTYPVDVRNNQGIDLTRAKLYVVDPPVFAATTLAYPSNTTSPAFVTNLVYDAQRKALLTTVRTQAFGSGQLLRYGYTSTWGMPTAVSQPQRSAIALSRDGTSLIAAIADGPTRRFNISELDPVTLAETRTTPGSQATGTLDQEGNEMAVANDGRAILVTGQGCCSGTSLLSYSPLLPSIGPLEIFPKFSRPLNAVVGASEDGANVLVVAEVSSGSFGLYRYDATTSQLAFTGATLRGRTINLNKRGDRILLSEFSDYRVYAADFTLLGVLPDTTVTAVLAPAGNRAYTYDMNGTVRVFDLTATPNGGLYPELPPITPAGSPGDQSVQTRMIITPDGGTLFIAGGLRIVVVPLT